MKHTLIALVFTGMAAAGAAAGPDWNGPPIPPPPEPGLHALHAMAEEVGLSDEQRASIEALVDQFRVDSAQDRERLSQIREKMQELSRNDEFFDRDALSTLADEMTGITSRMAVSGTELRWQIRQVLTGEQREELDARRGQHRHRVVRLEEPEP